MRILLHTCCAVCTIGPFEELSAEGHDVTGFFYNPNIHPLIEFRRRKKAQKALQEHLPVPMIYREQYGLKHFLRRVDWESPNRCRECYRMRLTETAQEAARRGFDAFSTTLLTSQNQKHDSVEQVAQECAEEAGVAFHYGDWRRLDDANRRRASRLGLYRQQYCGCIFSEYERFQHSLRHVYRGSGPARKT